MGKQTRIDINRADKDQLTSLDGVDELVAARIIQHRKVHGPFRSLAEVDNLEGLPTDALESIHQDAFVEVDPTAEERRRGGGPLAVRSPAFEDGGSIPRKYTCDGEDVAPPLEWEGAPPETKSFLLLMEDPDAPSGVFRHWALYDIAAERTRLPEATTSGAKTERLGHGSNDFGSDHYRGPCPPRGHGAHRYVFRLAALNVPTLQVPDDPSALDVWRAGEPYIIAEATLTGRYGRPS